MKKKDIAIIFVVSVVSAVISIIISGLLITPSEGRSQSVEVAPAIQAELNSVDKFYFNIEANNPAQDIQVGQDPTSNPFAGQ